MRRQKSNNRFSRVNRNKTYKSQRFTGKKHDTSKAYQETNESNNDSFISDSEINEIKKFIVSGSNLLRNKGESIPYLIEPIFQQTGVVSLVGSSDTGKSSFLRQMATAIVHGDSDFLGFKINPRYNRVVYVSTEDDEINMAHLLSKQNINNLPNEKYDKLGFIFDSSNIVKRLDLTLKKFPVDCVIIDAFADVFSGNINQTIDVRNFLDKYSRLAVKYKCLIIFLHHTAKRTENLEPSKNNSIGSQGFEGKVRMMIELRKDFSDPTVRHMCIVKGNYLPQEYKESSYVLKFENMRFTNLNRRVPFDRLGKPEVSKNIAKEKAIEYKLQGLSINEIMDQLRMEGHTPARSTIANWVRNLNPNEAAYGFESDEPDLMSDPEEESNE